jgi:glycosyltransferase involved in cell wall biosynthesis
MVVAECMAIGLPVVASNLCGMPDMIEDDKTGLLVEPFDTAAIASAIDRLFSNSDERQSISEQAKESARNNFHPQSVAQATLLAYQKVTASLP